MKRSMVDVLLRLFIDETTERRSLRHGATILVEAEGAQRACCVARLYVVDNAQVEPLDGRRPTRTRVRARGHSCCCVTWLRPRTAALADTSLSHVAALTYAAN